MSTQLTPELRSQYKALKDAVGVGEFVGRTQIKLTGADRAAFLHSLCTNDIKALRPGEGCEAFLTNVQGKVVGFVYVLCHQESLVLDTVAEQAEEILAGLDRYLIREDVQLSDQTESRREWIIAGNTAEQWLVERLSVEVPQHAYHHVSFPYEGAPLSLRRIPYTGAACFFLSAEAEGDSAPAIDRLWQSEGLSWCDSAAVEMARIEAGTPVFGRDISKDNLPQEINRDQIAISFTKGCYLGQETVARLDALGHVNRMLVGIRFGGEQIPDPAAVLVEGEKTVARLTSTCWSPKLEAPLALAFVRRKFAEAGTRLESPWGEAEVVPLPLADGDAR